MTVPLGHTSLVSFSGVGGKAQVVSNSAPLIGEVDCLYIGLEIVDP